MVNKNKIDNKTSGRYIKFKEITFKFKFQKILDN